MREGSRMSREKSDIARWATWVIPVVSIGRQGETGMRDLGNAIIKIKIHRRKQD
jgi:hypothetical protein